MGQGPAAEGPCRPDPGGRPRGRASRTATRYGTRSRRPIARLGCRAGRRATQSVSQPPPRTKSFPCTACTESASRATSTVGPSESEGISNIGRAYRCRIQPYQPTVGIVPGRRIMTEPTKIAPADGKLGILTPGMGAVVDHIRRRVCSLPARDMPNPPGRSASSPTSGWASGARAATRRSRTSSRWPSLDDLEFGGWDPYSDDAYAAAMKAGVLDARHIEGIGDELRAIKPMSAVFSRVGSGISTTPTRSRPDSAPTWTVPRH